MKISKNAFHAFKNKSIVQKISLTGVFLGLVLLFQFLEKFMPFGNTYLKLNFSLLFILPIFYFAGPLFGIASLGIRFGVGFASSGDGFPWISQTILLISTSVAIAYMYLFSLVLNSIKKHNAKVIAISVATVLATSLTLTILNGLWFTPWYWHNFAPKSVPHPYFTKEVIKTYEYDYKGSGKTLFFGIPSYWGGVFGVYLSGNLVKFGLVYMIYLPLSKVLRHYL